MSRSTAVHGFLESMPYTHAAQHYLYLQPNKKHVTKKCVMYAATIYGMHTVLLRNESIIYRCARRYSWHLASSIILLQLFGVSQIYHNNRNTFKYFLGHIRGKYVFSYVLILSVAGCSFL